MSSLNLYETYTDVEKAIDLAIDGHFVIKFYDYRKIKQVKKVEMEEIIPKPQARKIKNYLNEILEDALRYNHDRRRGRRKKETK